MKTTFDRHLAGKIAKTMLVIGATTFSLLKEFIWACGMKMHIYNDNRMMLDTHEHRMTITEGFINLIHGEKINPDYIIGTMTSGVAPAASVAQYMGKKLLINYKDEYYIYPEKLYTEHNLELLKKILPEKEEPRDIDCMIIATSPLMIPYGVQYANKLGIGFAYTREQKKDHGKEQWIEGVIKPGTNFILLYGSESHKEMAYLANKIEEEFKVKRVGSLGGEKKHWKISASELAGKIAVLIEDLFSTGGSSAFEVYKARLAGLICNHCFSIFSYGFDCLKKQFSGEVNISNKDVKLTEPCEIDSLLPFSVLLEEIKLLRFYHPDIIHAMEEEINGFDKRYKQFLVIKETNEHF